MRDYIPIRKLACEYGLNESSVIELLAHYTYAVNEYLAALAGVGFPDVFPDVFGCVDGTCTEVRPPEEDTSRDYRGDKKFSFINAQVRVFRLCSAC